MDNETNPLNYLPKQLEALLKHMFYECPFNRGLRECLLIGIKNNNAIIVNQVVKIIQDYTGYRNEFILPRITLISKL